MPNLIGRARIFAGLAHGSQKRKYTGEPYIVHPVEVSEIVAWHNGSKEMIAAALLHDTVEDTDVTIDDIRNEFGNAVALLVDDLTDVSIVLHVKQWIAIILQTQVPPLWLLKRQT